MRLSDKDAKLFYKLWLGLIYFVNKKHNIEPNLGDVKSPKGIDAQKLLPIKDKLWADVSVIDEYIGHVSTSLNEEECEILSGWKNFVGGQVIAVKHLKNYTVFMTQGDNAQLYGAIGIYSTFEEIIPKWAMPKMVDIILLPFKGRIIFDSLLRPYNINFGSGYRSDINDVYRSLKEKYGVITNLFSSSSIGNFKMEKRGQNVCVATEIVKKVEDIKKSTYKSSSKITSTQRRKRIEEEILIDTYGEYEEASAWHCYLEDNLKVPFKAVCIMRIDLFPLIKGDEVTVKRMADVDVYCGGMFVMVEWAGRNFAVPLEQLEAIGTDYKTAEAVEDWKYWQRI